MKNLEALDQEPYLWDYLQTVQKPIVLYGMGNGADAILDRCGRLGIPVAAAISPSLLSIASLASCLHRAT